MVSILNYYYCIITYKYSKFIHWTIDFVVFTWHALYLAILMVNLLELQCNIIIIASKSLFCHFPLIACKICICKVYPSILLSFHSPSQSYAGKLTIVKTCLASTAAATTTHIPTTKLHLPTLLNLLDDTISRIVLLWFQITHHIIVIVLCCFISYVCPSFHSG